MSGPSDDLFPGFRSEMLPGAGVDIFCRIGGDGPPLVLQHGFPQTHVTWHKIAPALAEHFTLVLPDLRGYGQSGIARTVDDHATYSKRAMAADIAAIMTALGHESFAFAGHDRGARVGYRLALDHPDRVAKLAVLDIVTTYDEWQKADAKWGMETYHWLMLAQPHPLPEMLIGGVSADYMDYTLASWADGNSLKAFDRRALASYRAAMSDPERIHAACEDYRAGYGIDTELDRQNLEAGHKIHCPLLVLWGAGGIPNQGGNPLHAWHRWAPQATGKALPCGHFLAEELPSETASALLTFFRGS